MVTEHVERFLSHVTLVSRSPVTPAALGLQCEIDVFFVSEQRRVETGFTIQFQHRGPHSELMFPVMAAANCRNETSVPVTAPNILLAIIVLAVPEEIADVYSPAARIMSSS